MHDLGGEPDHALGALSHDMDANVLDGTLMDCEWKVTLWNAARGHKVRLVIEALQSLLIC